MQSLYALEVGGGDIRHYLDTFIRPELADDENNVKFAERLLIRTLDIVDDADDIIHRHTQNWDISRIALVDHILLRMAICELTAFEDIPPKVTLNESIEIAKLYSTPRSGQFINGVLDAVIAELRQEGRLRKSGRGLVGMDELHDRPDK